MCLFVLITYDMPGANTFSSCVVPVQQRSAKWNGITTNARETVYQDERSRNAELHAQNEKLNAENAHLEHELQESRREVAVLKQCIEELRVNLLIRQVLLQLQSLILTIIRIQ
jgi:predicted RNase H-like nuclease (RuvC/YqgF family)